MFKSNPSNTNDSEEKISKTLVKVLAEYLQASLHEHKNSLANSIEQSSEFLHELAIKIASLESKPEDSEKSSSMP